MTWTPIVGGFPVGALGRPWGVFGRVRSICVTDEQIRSSLAILTESIAMSSPIELINEDLYLSLSVTGDTMYDPLVPLDPSLTQIRAVDEAIESLQVVNEELRRC